MNGRKAKQLRWAAMYRTSGGVPRRYNEGPKGVRLVADGTDAFGNPKFRERDITGRVTLDKGRTRAVYKALKRDYLREARCSHA